MTPREQEVLDLVQLGLSNKEIAARLGIEDGTVKKYLNSMFRKMNARNRTDLAMKAVRCSPGVLREVV